MLILISFIVQKLWILKSNSNGPSSDPRLQHSKWKRICRASLVVKEQKGNRGGNRQRRDATLPGPAGGSFRGVFSSAFLLASQVDLFSSFSTLFHSSSQVQLQTWRRGEETVKNITRFLCLSLSALLICSTGQMERETMTLLGPPPAVTYLSIFLVAESQPSSPSLLFFLFMTYFFQVTYKGQGFNSRVFHILALMLKC